MDDAHDKAAWRRAIRARRRARCADPQAATTRAAHARALADHILPALGARTVVAAYRSLPTEPPTTALLHELLRRQHRVLLPDMLTDRDLAWRELTDDADPGPQYDVDEIRHADWVLVPALAVDITGTRLGQGGGSYDRALARLRPGTPVVALLYDDELLTGAGDGPSGEPELPDRLPREDHDVPVSAVVTPAGGWQQLDPPPQR